MAFYRQDQSSKSVPDQNIVLVFESALNVEDDYLRLLKITEGIKYLTQKLPSAVTFSSSKLLYQLFCLYPFQKENIEVIISAFFEYFQDFRFLSAFYEAAFDVSSLQEKGNGQSFKQRITMFANSKNNTSNSDGLPLSQKVIAEFTTIKLFSVNFLKKFFLIANQLQLDFQLYCLLFKGYIQHTQNQQLITNVMDCYQELRHSIFLKCDWANQLSEEIILYFKNTPKLFPQYKKYDIVIIEDSDHSEKSEEQITITQLQNKRRSYVSQEQDPSLYLQKLCCNQDVDAPLEHNSAFEDAENIDILLQLILDPIQISIAPIWAEQYPTLPDISDPEGIMFKKDSSCVLTKYYVYRSYKALALLTNIENFTNLHKLHPQIYLKICNVIFFYHLLVQFSSLNLNDTSKNINFYHLGSFLNFLLSLQPKFCIKQMIEQQFFKKFLEFSYNPSIWKVLFEIVNINGDYYQLGTYYQEQLWRYLYIVNWVDALINLISQTSSSLREIDTNALSTSVSLLKALSIIDPQRAKLLKSKTIDSESKEQFNEKRDIDNIQQFMKEKDLFRTNTIIENAPYKRSESQNISQQAKLQRKSSNTFQLPKIQQNVCNLDYNQKQQNNMTQDTQLRGVMSNKRKRNQFSQHQGKNKLKTEFADTEMISNDGFPSSRLLSIYPTTKSIIFLSEFEKEKNNFLNNNLASQSCLKLFNTLLEELIFFAEQQEKLQNQQQKQQQTFPIDFLIKEFIFEKSINVLFKVFLYYILELPHKSDSFAVSCGILLNKLYIYSVKMPILNQITEVLKIQFQQIVDYLIKAIVQLNSIKQQMESQQFSFIQYLLMSVLTNGLHHYENQNYMIKIDKQLRSVFRNLTDTSLHILIIWFSDSYQNTIYQQLFTKFIAIYFAGAPAPYLFNLIFKIGLLSTIYNAYYKFYQNEIKDTSYVEGLFFHVLLVNYTIRNSIKFRNLSELQSSINYLDSWLLLENAQPFQNTIALQNIDHLINLENQSKIQEPKVEKKVEKPSKFNKLKTQINTKVTSLVSLQSKSSLQQLSQRQ